VKPEPDWARAVALARRERGVRGGRGGRRGLVFTALLAAGLHAAAGFASLGAASDVPVARTREVDVMKFSKLAAAGAVMVASAAFGGGKNLIVNGGFEQGPAQSDCAWVLYGAGNQSITGWHVAQGNVDRVRMTEQCPPMTEVWRSFEGEFTIDTTGTANGTLCQAVTLTPGSRYRLEFAVSGNCMAPRTMPLTVRVGSVARSFDYVCAAKALQPWVIEFMDFNATSSSAEVCFVSTSPFFSGGTVIDAVSIVEIPLCSGDVIENGVVDGADLAALLTVWGTSGGIYPRADTNTDGVVDGADLAVVLGGWGACP